MQLPSSLCYVCQLAILCRHSRLFLELCQAISAYSLILEKHHLICIPAEDARRLIFLQNDLLAIGKNLHGIIGIDVQVITDTAG